MATNVIMPALELAQETGKLLRWIKAPGDTVKKGEPIAEVETDKVTIELEAPAAGVLRDVTAQEGDVVPVGHTIAIIAAAGEALSSTLSPRGRGPGGEGPAGEGPGGDLRVKASPLARRIAEEHGVDLARVKAASGKIEKADVLAYVESRKMVAAPTNGSAGRLVAASPQARRLAAERGIDLRSLKGSGPGGAVLTMDLPLTAAPLTTAPLTTAPLTLPSPHRLTDLDLVWYEEPVLADDLAACAAVAARIDIPVATGENNYTRFEFRDLIERRAARYLMPDVCRANGFSETLKIGRLAAAHQVATRASGRPLSVTATATTISLLRGASGTRASIASK